MPEEFWGVREIASALGVSRQRVHQLAASYSDFPAPVAQLSRQHVWHRRDVEQWIGAHEQRPTGKHLNKGDDDD